jgi:hypothetical protein
VKFLIIIYSNPLSWEHPVFLHHAQTRQLDPHEREELNGELQALLDELRTSGELQSIMAMDAPERARTIRVRDRIVTTTDGPYAETKEQMAGAFLVECASRERAEEIAARFPDARFGAVEVRPLSF